MDNCQIKGLLVLVSKSELFIEFDGCLNQPGFLSLPNIFRWIPKPYKNFGVVSFPYLIKFLSLLLLRLTFINFRDATNQASLDNAHIFFTLLPKSPNCPKRCPELFPLLLPLDQDEHRIDNQVYLQLIQTQNHLRTT